MAQTHFKSVDALSKHYGRVDKRLREEVAYALNETAKWAKRINTKAKKKIGGRKANARSYGEQQAKTTAKAHKITHRARANSLFAVMTIRPFGYDPSEYRGTIDNNPHGVLVRAYCTKYPLRYACVIKDKVKGRKVVKVRTRSGGGKRAPRLPIMSPLAFDTRYLSHSNRLTNIVFNRNMRIALRVAVKLKSGNSRTKYVIMNY